LPLVLVSSLLIVGWQLSLPVFIAGVVLAELARPLWQPLRNATQLPASPNSLRWGQMAGHLAAMLAGTAVFLYTGSQLPLDDFILEEWPAFAALAGTYTAVALLLNWLVWWYIHRDGRGFWRKNGTAVFTFTLFSQPFALLGGVTFLRTGLPGFVLFSIGVMLVSAIIRISRQNRYMLEQRLTQFARLNDASLSLRETLDLNEVLARTEAQIRALVPADAVDITLFSETPPSDDFTRWVAENGRLLDLDRGNMHYAGRHKMTPPHPHPLAWLGIPLVAGEQTIGAIALYRLEGGQPFSRWHRELLVALAGQASSAIENARLYNLTDMALARRVEQLQALVNSMTEGVLMVDRHGRILLVNQMAADLLGQPAADLLEKPLNPHPAIGLDAAALAGLRLNLAAAKTAPGAAYVYQTGQPPRHIERTGTAVRAADGRVMGWLMLFRDVTEAQELAEQRADLSRMIVHDLRNPLTTLLTVLEMAEPEPPVVTAQQQAQDMLDMVDSLMDMNRWEAGQLAQEAEAMRLPPLVTQVMARLRPLAEQKQIQFTFTCDEELPAVWADAEIIRRVLVNLLDNALKFTPSGGKVGGRLLAEPAANPKREAGVRCILVDTGPGIPPQFQEQVFARYMRTNPGGAQVRGPGLGLTFC
ncbi:MAG: PAS domain-containing protein, partial [Anaerolineae bacterium]